MTHHLQAVRTSNGDKPMWWFCGEVQVVVGTIRTTVREDSFVYVIMDIELSGALLRFRSGLN